MLTKSKSELTLLLLLAVLQLHCSLVAAAIEVGFSKPVEKADRPLCKPGQAAPPNRFNSSDRVTQLRQALQLNESVFYLQTDTDRFLSSPQPDQQFRLWLSGFAGSAGSALLSGQVQMMFTDSRYTVQADQELDCNWELYDRSRYTDWLMANQNKITLLADKQQVSAKLWRQLQNLSNVHLVGLEQNPIDELWTQDRPKKVQQEIYPLPERFTGRQWPLKSQMTRETAKSRGVDCVAVTALDDIAYLLNLRATVVSYNPYFPSSVLICQNSMHVFVDNANVFKTNATLVEHFRDCSGGPCPIFGNLSDYSSTVRGLNISKVSIDLASASQATASAFAEEKIHDAPSPVANVKAVKDSKERLEFANCSLYDSAALVAFLNDLEHRMGRNEKMSELSAAALLREYRSRLREFRGLSFETIAAVGPNAAVVHYRPAPSTDRQLSHNEVFLLDSGGQYLGCTTDVTRTLYYGAEPQAEVRAAYTRVLAGVIDLFDLTWPISMTTDRFDAFARHNLWSVGQNYGHGTGHGIGQFLSVHEGPNGIGRRVSLEEGNFQSIEPGFYQREAQGQLGFGIRLETITGVHVVNISAQAGASYMRFSPVTWVPFEKKLIELKLLNDRQLKWLNWYHSQCRVKLEEVLPKIGQQSALNWVLTRTDPVIRSSATSSIAASTAAAVAAAAAVALLMPKLS